MADSKTSQPSSFMCAKASNWLPSQPLSSLPRGVNVAMVPSRVWPAKSSKQTVRESFFQGVRTSKPKRCGSLFETLSSRIGRLSLPAATTRT